MVILESTDGTCGIKHNNKKCKSRTYINSANVTASVPDACSKYGYCGNSISNCDETNVFHASGTLPLWCSKTTNNKPVISKNGPCFSNGMRCPDGQACGSDNKCSWKQSSCDINKSNTYH